MKDSELELTVFSFWTPDQQANELSMFSFRTPGSRKYSVFAYAELAKTPNKMSISLVL